MRERPLGAVLGDPDATVVGAESRHLRMRQRNRSIELKRSFDCYFGSANCRVATWC